MLSNETMGTHVPDFLVYDSKLPMDTMTVTVKSGAGKLKRGTVLAFTAAAPYTEGAAWTGAADQVAGCVLCDDVDTGTETGGAVVAHAYRVGHLCRQALLFGDGATELTEAAEKQLADAGITLSNAVL